MSEGSEVGEILGRIKSRVEKRDELADAGKSREESMEDKLLRSLKGPGRLVTTELEADPEVLKDIENKARLTREWLFLNGRTVDELSEEERDYLLGGGDYDSEDLGDVRCAMDGAIGDSVSLICDFSNEFKEQELEVGVMTGESNVKAHLSSNGLYRLYIDFPDWKLETAYMTDDAPFETMDRDQAKIIIRYLDLAMEKFGIPRD